MDDIVKVTEIIGGGHSIRMIGDMIIEKVNWPVGTSITRTYWDGEKLVTEGIDPDDFYAPKAE